jgi:hypothetical protein
MKRRLIAAAALCLVAASPAWAQESPAAQIEALRRMVEEALKQNEELRKRVLELEEAVSKQAPAAKEPTAPAAPKEPAPAVAAQPPPKPPAVAPAEPISAAKGPWGKVQIGGAVEVEASSVRGFTGKRQSEFKLTTAEFDFEADIVDWAKAELSFEWDSGADKVTLNEAFITLMKAGFPVYGKAGRGIAPFGISTGTTVAARLEDTLTITGPLTTDVFEIKTDYGLVGIRKWGFHLAGYIFNGTTNDVPGGGKQLNHYGFAAGYEYKGDPFSAILGVEWVNSVMDATGLVEAFSEFQERGINYVPGLSLHAKLGFWGFSLILEYDTAIHNKRLIRDEQIYNVQPEAWQVEFGYTTDIFWDFRTYVAVNYSTTASLLGAFPKQRLLGVLGVWLADNIRLAAEYGAEKDYSKVQRGTGAHGDSWIVRLTYEW